VVQKWVRPKKRRHCVDQLDDVLEHIIETYKDSCQADEKYFYSEIFCKWWGDLMLGIGPVKRVQEYAKTNVTFQYEMQLVPRHSHDKNFSGKLALKPEWSRCDHCDDTRKFLSEIFAVFFLTIHKQGAYFVIQCYRKKKFEYYMPFSSKLRSANILCKNP